MYDESLGSNITDSILKEAKAKIDEKRKKKIKIEKSMKIKK